MWNSNLARRFEAIDLRPSSFPSPAAMSQRIAASGLESRAGFVDPLPVTHAQHDPTDLLADVLSKKAGGFVELRYHKKRTRAVAVEKGRLDTAQITEHTGV